MQWHSVLRRLAKQDFAARIVQHVCNAESGCYGKTVMHTQFNSL